MGLVGPLWAEVWRGWMCERGIVIIVRKREFCLDSSRDSRTDHPFLGCFSLFHSYSSILTSPHQLLMLLYEKKFCFSTWLGRVKSSNLSFIGHYHILFSVEETQKSPCPLQKRFRRQLSCDPLGL